MKPEAWIFINKENSSQVLSREFWQRFTEYFRKAASETSSINVFLKESEKKIKTECKKLLY